MPPCAAASATTPDNWLTRDNGVVSVSPESGRSRMKSYRSQIAAATLLFALSMVSALDAHATSVLPLDLDQITARAKDIVHVRCTRNEVERDAAVGVVTVTTFVVLDRAKGGEGASFVVRQPGGELDGVAVNFRVPKFAVGEEYVLFMPPASSLGLASPVGLSQGAFAVTPGQAGKEVGNGEDFSHLLSSKDRANARPGIAARLNAGPSERTRLRLTDFMALLREKAANQ
jgi:hypothetical protein